MTKQMERVIGNTYPVKDAIRELGGKWNADEKCWMVPSDKLQQAQALVVAQPAPKPGVCSKCGASCKPPFTLCLKCKPAPARCRQCGARPGPRGWPRIYRNGICSDCYQSDREEAEMGY